MDTLTVVTVRIRGGKKNRATIISVITFLWDSGYNDIIINSKHNGPYELRMCSNKFEYSMAAGPYCATHDFNVPFCVPDFSSSKIRLH